MISRDNIKVLEMMTKAFPLVVSMTLHVVIVLAFAIARQNHEREEILLWNW